MKTKKLLLGLIGSITVAAFILISCEKENTNLISDELLQVSEDDALATTIFDDVYDYVENALISLQLKSTDAMMVQLEIPIETVQKAIQLAKRHNIMTVIDPTPVPKDGIPDELFNVDIFCPNKSEAELIIKRQIRNGEDIKKAGRIHNPTESISKN